MVNFLKFKSALSFFNYCTYKIGGSVMCDIPQLNQ